MTAIALPRNRSVRREETRTEILEAAASAIAEHGYHGMSMRALAKSTGRGLANFYNYFTSKEDLLFALQKHAFQTLITTVERSLADADNPRVRLYILIFNHIHYVAEHRDAMRVLVHEASALPAARRQVVRNLKEKYFQIGRDIVAAILEECRSDGPTRVAGRYREAEIERAAYSVFGMLNWSYRWYDPGRHGSAHDVARTIHRLTICGLLGDPSYRDLGHEIDRHLATFSAPPLIGTAPRPGPRRGDLP